MKKNLLIIAAIASATLVSCSSEEFAGEEANSIPAESEAIVFNSNTSALTRADLLGAAAAEKLSNKFVVYGTKHADAEDATADNDALVFDNFLVEWGSGTAGTTESNSSDWEYIGKTAYSSAVTSTQGIKYWDYSAAQGYTFYAFSSTDISYPANANDKVSFSKVTADATTPGSLYNKGYSVTISPSAKLEEIFFSDRTPVAKNKYGQPVSLTFRNFGAKVRVGFYETIPGYSVKIDNFYINADDPTAPVTNFADMNDAQTVFAASLQNITRSADQTLNITYYDNSDATIENRPKLTQPTAGYDYSLKLGNGTGIINKTLGTTSSAPTWVAGKTAENYYIPVFPFEDNTNPMLIKLDFTLTSDDGTNEVIKVRGARAIVPAEYVKWKSNFAYTYLFKISDKGNGTTGKVDANGDPIEDPEGLKPITFDAVVVDISGERQETITSVSTNSITTYAEGAIADEYKVGKPIYVAITGDDHNVITPSAIGIGAGQARVYKIDKATTEASVLAKLTGSPIDITLSPLTPPATIATTIPLADGTTAAIANVMFTPATAGYYAYVYTTTAYVAPTYEALANSNDTYSSGTTYYLKSESGAYYPVSVATEAAFTANKDKLYKQTAAGTPGVYDIKIIKVQ